MPWKKYGKMILLNIYLNNEQCPVIGSDFNKSPGRKPNHLYHAHHSKACKLQPFFIFLQMNILIASSRGGGLDRHVESHIHVESYVYPGVKHRQTNTNSQTQNPSSIPQHHTYTRISTHRNPRYHTKNQRGVTPQTIHRMHIHKKHKSHRIQHQRQTRPIRKSSKRQKGNSHLHNNQHEHTTIQWTPAENPQNTTPHS